MKRYILHEPFNIYHFETAEWQHPVHNHTYFEIIFILKGKGDHNINGNSFKYSRGDIFLLGPEDYHDFSITAPTEFCYIRFNESFNKYNGLDEDKNWQRTVNVLLHSSYQNRGSIVQDKKEKQKLHYLLTVLRAEYENRHDSNFEIIRESVMRSIMVILARSVVKQSLTASNIKMSSVEAILHYIRQNIYNPRCLTVEHLAEQFHLAPAYISIFFKKHTGEALKQYIIKYKLKLIETRLLYSQRNLGEIADEFGYADESHLCKQFRKYTGVTPSRFRNK